MPNNILYKKNDTCKMTFDCLDKIITRIEITKYYINIFAIIMCFSITALECNDYDKGSICIYIKASSFL